MGFRVDSDDGGRRGGFYLARNRGSLKKSNRMMESGDVPKMGVFPFGKVSRKIQRRIQNDVSHTTIR